MDIKTLIQALQKIDGVRLVAVDYGDISLKFNKHDTKKEGVENGNFTARN